MRLNDKQLASQIASGIIEYLKKIKKEDALTTVIKLLQKEKDSKKAYIYSPNALKQEDQKKVSAMLKRLTGDEIESFVFSKDETLIDGLKIYYKDKLWDFSLATQINGLTKES